MGKKQTKKTVHSFEGGQETKEVEYDDYDDNIGDDYLQQVDNYDYEQPVEPYNFIIDMPQKEIPLDIPEPHRIDYHYKGFVITNFNNIKKRKNDFYTPNKSPLKKPIF